MFFAAILALIVFCGVLFLVFSFIIGGLMASDVAKVPPGSVLYIDLSKNFSEKKIENPLLLITGNVEDEVPTLYELTRMIRKAKTDTTIKGIYIKSNSNVNGYAASEELRNVLMDFKKSGKFIYAYGDYISQKAYHVSNIASRIYCNPKGMIDWTGLSVEYMYFKNLLNKLEIEPQIFYDGKFKSATEPFREEKMTDANRLQTSVWLGDIYQHFLQNTSNARGIDTATLRRYANEYAIETPQNAVDFKIIDGVRYDDEVKDEIKKKLKLGEDDKISFVTPGTYMHAVTLTDFGQTNKIAVVLAEGEIVDGKGEEGQIGSDEYRNLIRKLRYNKDIKAIVVRINSPGGSSLASENIWRELYLAKKAGKPVVVSMGDVAASGGYYMACIADSIFAQPNTITGSIGVFAMIPNMGSFFKNKLGITFDRVKTSEYAGTLTITKPLNPQERIIIQREVDHIYKDFISRVADGRKRDTAYIATIAQGRVWTGERAIGIGLVDRIGDIETAIRAAASLAKIKDYNIREYPEPKSPIDLLFGSLSTVTKNKILEDELGSENFEMYKKMKQLKENMGMIQARMPFEWKWN